MTQPFVFSLKFTAETSQAKAKVAEIVRETAGLGPAAKTAAQGAVPGFTALDQVLGRTGGSVAALSGQFSTAQTAITGAQAAVTGLNTNISRQAAEIAATAQETANWQAALDQVRAQFNPLFAASKQYEAELRRIDAAEEMTALSATEAAAARERAAQAIAPMSNALQGYGNAVGRSSAYTANLVSQWNDVGVMMVAGQSPIQLALQQGTQISQVLTLMARDGTSPLKAIGTSLMGLVNPISLITVGVIALGAAGVQAFSKMVPPAVDLDEALQKVGDSIKKLRELLQTSPNDLKRRFGEVTQEVRNMIEASQELARLQAAERLRTVQTGIYGTADVGFKDGLVYTDNELGRAQKLRNELSLTLPVAKELEEQMRAARVEGDPAALADSYQAMYQLVLSSVGGYKALNKEQRTFLENLVHAEEAARELAAAGTNVGDFFSRSIDKAIARGEEFAGKLKSLADQTADLQLDASLIGATPATRLRSEAKRDAERYIRDQGLVGGEAERIRREYQAAAEAQVERDRRQRAEDARRQGQLSQYDALARLTPNPISRAAIEAEREYARVLAETGDAQAAAAAATRVRNEAAAELKGSLLDLARAQDQHLERLRLEATLVGATPAARSRALAAYEAEIELRKMGADLSSREAQGIRDAALATDDWQRHVARLEDAWNKVRDAAEGAIDGPIDALLNGDLDGALKSFAKEVTGLFAELAIKNPLKNGLLGTDYPTMGDVGGLKGIASWLTGRGGGAQSVARMQVAAGTVILSGAGVTSLIGGPGADRLGANLDTRPGALNAATGGDAAAILKAVATGGGLRPDAITGLNAGFSGPLAGLIREAQGQFGQGAVQVYSGYRSPEVQKRLWDQALAKYGDPEIADNWVAPPGRSRHNFGLAADLRFGSPQVRDWMHENAGRYGLGFRMGNEPWHIEPQNAQGMLAGQAALPADQLQALATQASAAATSVGDLGTGAGSVGKLLSDVLPQGLKATAPTVRAPAGQVGTMQVTAGTVTIAGGIGAMAGAGAGGAAGGGAGGGFFGQILGAIFGFDQGGPTGGSSPDEVRGVVHGKEYVFDAKSTARIGVPALEALRKGALKGYREGGYVVGGSSYPVSNGGTAASGDSGISIPITINDYAGVPVQAEESRDARGRRQVVMTLGEQGAASVAQPGNPLPRQLEKQYGLRRRGPQR